MQDQEQKEIGPIVNISGQSGTGKTSVMTLLHQWQGVRHHLPLERVVTTTTREKRSGEIDGIDYHFCDVLKFNELESNGLFIETDTYDKQRYGTQESSVRTIWRRNRVPLSNNTIPNGVGAMKKRFPHMCVIFFQAPSIEVLEERLLRNRLGATRENLTDRLRCAAEEQKAAQTLADHILIADDNTVDQMALCVLNILYNYLARYQIGNLLLYGYRHVPPTIHRIKSEETWVPEAFKYK